MILNIILSFLKKQFFKIAIGLALVFSIIGLRHYQKAYVRVKNNQEALLNENKKTNQSLMLTKSEFKNYINSNKKIKKLLTDSLKVSIGKIKNLEQYKTKYELSLNMNMHDTIIKYRIIKKDSVSVHSIKAKNFHWEDKWTHLSGLCYNNKVSINLRSVDSIYLTVFWKRVGRFLPVLFGHKVYRAKIINFNPHNKIIIGKRIKVIHRKIIE